MRSRTRIVFTNKKKRTGERRGVRFSTVRRLSHSAARRSAQQPAGRAPARARDYRQDAALAAEEASERPSEQRELDHRRTLSSEAHVIIQDDFRLSSHHQGFGIVLGRVDIL